MNLNKFFAIAWERHRIYVLKELGIQKPWTQDPIFLDYYFCNVFRYLDKTSKWIIKNAIEPNEDDCHLWKTIIMCRYISRISTLKNLQDTNCLIDNQEWAYKNLRIMQKEGLKIFTNAFIVNSKTPSGWSDKVTYLFELIKEIHYRYNGKADFYLRGMVSMRQLYDELLGLPGVGPFMAYQYTVDFTYSKRYLYDAHDTQTWTSLGLGAVRGMNRLLTGFPSRTKIPDGIELAQHILDEWKHHVALNLRDQVTHTYKIIQKRWAHSDPPPDRNYVLSLYKPFAFLTMMDVEHQICEYDKYMRGGSKKRRYYGHV